MTVIDLTTRRIERLEKQQKETNDRLGRVDERLGRVEDALGRIVSVLEVHSRHFERMEEALYGISDRVDRLTRAIARGRTQDLARFDAIERRLMVLERARPRKRARH
jgi:chromosome segregation ATPase